MNSSSIHQLLQMTSIFTLDYNKQSKNLQIVYRIEPWDRGIRGSSKWHTLKPNLRFPGGVNTTPLTFPDKKVKATGTLVFSFCWSLSV